MLLPVISAGRHRAQSDRVWYSCNLVRLDIKKDMSTGNESREWKLELQPGSFIYEYTSMHHG